MTPKEQDEPVMHVYDLKGPLKGKGGTLVQWRKEAEARLARIWSDMIELSAESTAIEGRSFGLKVYRVRDGRQLRWRMTNSRHATWARIEPLLKGLAPGLALWYRQAQEVSQILNHREQVARYEVKTVERLATVGERKPRSYRATVGRGVGGGRPTDRG